MPSVSGSGHRRHQQQWQSSSLCHRLGPACPESVKTSCSKSWAGGHLSEWIHFGTAAIRRDWQIRGQRNENSQGREREAECRDPRGRREATWLDYGPVGGAMEKQMGRRAADEEEKKQRQRRKEETYQSGGVSEAGSGRQLSGSDLTGLRQRRFEMMRPSAQN